MAQEDYRETAAIEGQAGLGLSKIWLFSRNPRVCTFSHGFDHAKNENDDDFAV